MNRGKAAGAALRCGCLNQLESEALFVYSKVQGPTSGDFGPETRDLELFDALSKMKTKILIVEDDPHILLGLEEVLKSEGFDIAVCNRGDIALDAVGRHRPSLILLD